MSEPKHVDVPVLDLKRQYEDIKPQVDEAIADVIERSAFVLGPAVRSFEERMAAYCECSHAVGVASGTDALLLALEAVGIGPGDEVITTPFSFIATANTISRVGGRPIFVDVEPDTLNIDVAQIDGAITERTKAIIPVHLFGHPAEMDAIMDVAAKHGLVVIEDAAQAIGARYKGRAAGSMGLLGCLSFYPTKNLGAYGDAGMIVTGDAELAGKIDVLRQQGGRTKYEAEILGTNSRLDSLQAAILGVKLDHLDQWNESRRRLAATYRELLDGLPVQVPVERPQVRHVYHQFTIQVEQRDALGVFLKSRGIGSMIYYPVPIHRQKLYEGQYPQSYPVAERAAKRVLSLPMYPELTDEQQAAVANGVRDFFAD